MNKLVIKFFVEPTGKIPTRGKQGDAGLDCFADLSTFDNQTCALNVGQSAKIPLGFHYAFFYNNLGELTPTNDYYFEIANRSGFGLKEMVTEVSRICDSSYRGVPHYSIAKIGGDPTIIQHHQKICQMLIHPFVDPYKFEILQVESIEELGSTSRGSNGFNSSGSF
jgi:dUTPase